MAGIDCGVAGQCEQFFAYCVYQVAVVAVGEIGAATASAEQRIATEEHLCLGHMVGKAAGGVSGNGDGHNAAVAEEDFIAIIKHPAKGWHRLVISHSKAGNAFLDVLGPRPVGIVGTGFYTECFLNECIAEYVVKVQVGVEVVLKCQAVILNELSYLFTFLWEPCSAVNEHSLLGLVPKQVAVHLYRVYYEFLELHNYIKQTLRNLSFRGC